MGRPAQREISLRSRTKRKPLPRNRPSFFSYPFFLDDRRLSISHCTSSHLVPRSASGPHLTRLPNGQQIRRPLPRRNHQPSQTHKPTQSPTTPRLHPEIQRNQTSLVRTSRRTPLRNLPRKRNQILAPLQKSSPDRIPKSPMERPEPAPLAATSSLLRLLRPARHDPVISNEAGRLFLPHSLPVYPG